MGAVLESDKIFNAVSVCRSFRLNGLQAILRNQQPEIKPITLLWQVGDLNAKGYLNSKVVTYHVDPEKAKEVIPTLDKPSERELHEEWRNWYQEEFRRYFKADDLAELIYHETACLEKDKPKLELLQQKTTEYLGEYYDEIRARQHVSLPKFFELKDQPARLPKAFTNLASRLQKKGEREQAQEAREYIPTVRRYITDLNRFEEIISTSEYNDFVKFLDALIAQIV